jgi:ribosomal protein S11
VLGHSECVAVKGAIDDVQLGNFTSALANMRTAVGAAARRRDWARHLCLMAASYPTGHGSERESARNSLAAIGTEIRHNGDQAAQKAGGARCKAMRITINVSLTIADYR